MKENHYLVDLAKKRAAIVTNNIHCERHVQYFSTIEKYFRSNGWEIAEDFNVHKIIICACGFHDAMYEKIKRTLERLKETYFLEKNIIIMACLTKTHRMDLEKHFNGQIIEYHQEELLDNIIHAKVPFKEIRLVNMYKIYEKCDHGNIENKRFYIKISEGCLRKCTFCVINKAKGYIRSVPFDKIAGQVKMAIECGRKEIFLMGEDTFAYGIDIGTDIIELVKKLKALDPTIDFYFGYLHIRWLKKYSKEILAFCKQGVLKELHIGLQHVNDEILRRMGRPQVFSEIYDIICTIKRECPWIYMVSDILVGFPGETDEMFTQLVEFFKKDKCFNKVKHFGYSDVKGALSAEFSDKVSPEIITSRWDYLDKILGVRAYSNQLQEPRIDNETFRITRFDDYSFCKDTFDEMIYNHPVSANLGVSKSTILNEDKEDFGF
jgi:ribosomal protein S12 methylthiotransferase